MKKPLMLMILDGWGINDHLDEKNVIRDVQPENYNRFWNEYPSTQIAASGEAVGLPDGQMGNSEVGHLNIGAGRVIYQPLVKISKEIRDGDILNNKVLLKLMNEVKDNGKNLHLSGLLSDGGVHSHIEHLYGLLSMAKKIGVKKVCIHAILDGRDTAPKSALKYLEALESKMKEIGIGEIVTLSGRYYAMDRDGRWERVQKAYDAIVLGQGNKAFSAKKAVEISYMEDISDEFFKPTVITDMAGNPKEQLKDGDGFLFFNYRPDRAREITRAINDEEFTSFTRGEKVNVSYVCMTQYDATIDAPVVYPADEISNTLGEVLAKNNLKQLRTAETEKYAHVTFFFNGGVEEPNKNEDRALIPSPKVATYDLKPEMSAYLVKDELLKRLDEHDYDLIVLNFANPDMVGHTGVMEAAVKAVEVVDECLGEVVEKILSMDGKIIITADHGNAENMINLDTNSPMTAHTTNKVPCIVLGEGDVKLNEGSKLCDIAPTLLKMMKIEKPEEMTGKSIINY